MAFEAGAITGLVTLDVSPMNQSLAAAKVSVTGFEAATSKVFQRIDQSMRYALSMGNLPAIVQKQNAALDQWAMTMGSVDSGLGKTTAQMQAATAEVNALNQAAQRASGGMAGMVKFIGPLLILSAAMAAVRVGADGVRKVMDDVRGGMSASQAIMKETASAMESLPFGVGTMLKGLGDLTDELNGSAEAARHLKAEVSEMNAIMLERRQALAAMAQAGEDAESRIASIGRAMKLVQSQTPGDRIRIQAEFDYQDAMAQGEKLQKLLDTMRNSKNLGADPAQRAAMADLEQRIGILKWQADYAKASASDRANTADASPIRDIEKSIRQFDMTDLQKQFDDLKESMHGKPELLERANVELEKFRGLQVGKVFEDLNAQLAQIDMSPLERKFDAFARQYKIIDPAELEKAKGVIEQIDIKGMLGEVKSPLEKYQETLKQLQAWRDAGKIDEAQFDKLDAKARRDSFGKMGENTLIRAGSAQDKLLQYQESRRGGALPIDNQKMQVAEQKITNNKLDLLIQYYRQQQTREKPVLVL